MPMPSPQQARQHILALSKKANVGHIGSCLCVVDMLCALYGGVMNIPSPTHPDRDRFVLSKGHAALALFAVLRQKGWLSEAELMSFLQDGSHLGVHPEAGVPGVDFGTGSLGHGLSMATGAALAARMQKSSRRAFALVSDAECNEGALWEAVMFAAHHRLANLVLLVDDNGQQALGYTREVLNLSPLARRFEAFGWQTIETDGHDVEGLKKLLGSLDTTQGPPHAVICRTTFGKGVSYMHSEIKWHYLPMNDEQYQQAQAEVGGTA